MFGALVLALAGLPAYVRAGRTEVLTPRANYLLNCGGCHGLNGVSNSRLVPDLKDQVGFFLNLPEGRRYVVRLPNVAFSMTTDEALTGLVNYVVFTLGGANVPKGAKPYTVREVSHLRRIPLTEVSLVQTRQEMVRILIDRYHATTDLRLYGGGDYGTSQ
ncbi:MAG: cytochrome C [Pseudomonadota bacterium]|nr:cytochrome C [Pseudomonadota bacterium]